MKDEREYFVYILASDRGMLYVGVTGDLFTRVAQHRSGIGSAYTKKYRCHRLVYYEVFQYVYDALDREKQIKKYGRKNKMDLIKALNPEWEDLFSKLGISERF